MGIIKILVYITIFIVSLIDIREKIISDFCLVILIILGLLMGYFNNNILIYFLQMGLFQLPLLFIYSLEDYVKRELIGFGDVKYVGVIGGLIGSEIKYTDRWIFFSSLLNFYKNLYLISGIFIIILFFYNGNIKNKYVPFGPFITISYILGDILQWGI